MTNPPTPAPSMPGGSLAGPEVWFGKDVRASTAWTRALSTTEVSELVAAAENTGAVPIESVGQKDFPLPTLAEELGEIRRDLLHGRGFVLLRGLPVEELPSSVVAAIFWGIGTYLGRAMPQNAEGHVLGHVRDLGRSAEDPSARIYQTRERQGYHTDSADVVGLLALRTARRGGLSTLASCAAVHNAMLERDPELLEELFGVFCTDHRGEFPEGSKPYFEAPILNWWEGKLSVLYQRRYIESAQRFADVPTLTGRQIAALDAFDRLLDDPDVHFAMQLEPGDMQFIHNHALLHDRTAFEDWPEPDRRRHLLRLWLSPPEGRELPPCFAARYGNLQPGCRGGVRLAPG